MAKVSRAVSSFHAYIGSTQFYRKYDEKTIKCYHNEKYLQKIISDLEQIKNYTLKIKIHILSLKPQLILTNYEIIRKNERIYFLSYFQVCSSNKYRK